MNTMTYASTDRLTIIHNIDDMQMNKHLNTEFLFPWENYMHAIKLRT